MQNADDQVQWLEMAALNAGTTGRAAESGSVTFYALERSSSQEDRSKLEFALAAYGRHALRSSGPTAVRGPIDRNRAFFTDRTSRHLPDDRESCHETYTFQLRSGSRHPCGISPCAVRSCGRDARVGPG